MWVALYYVANYWTLLDTRIACGAKGKIMDSVW